MRTAAATLKEYFSGFGLPAYTLESIPEDVSLPYLTYPLNIPEWSRQGTFYVQIFFRTTSNAPLIEKADQILEDIGTGKRFVSEEGTFVIWPESPAVQVLVEGDIRSAYLNLAVNSYFMPGQ